MDISSVVSKPITVLSKRINKPGKGKRTNNADRGVKRSAGEKRGPHTIAEKHVYIAQQACERDCCFRGRWRRRKVSTDVKTVSIRVRGTGTVRDGAELCLSSASGGESVPIDCDCVPSGLFVVTCVATCAVDCVAAADPGYVTSISRADQSSLERRVNFSELISPTTGPVDTSNVSLYEALKSVIEWTGQVKKRMRRNKEGRLRMLFRGGVEDTAGGFLRCRCMKAAGGGRLKCVMEWTGLTRERSDKCRAGEWMPVVVQRSRTGESRREMGPRLAAPYGRHVNMPTKAKYCLPSLARCPKFLLSCACRA